MVESKETIETFTVIFAIWDGKTIQLEERIKPESKYQGFIMVPGGEVESNETYEMALRREVKEEYGVRVTSFRPIGVIRGVEDGYINKFRHVYLVDGWEGGLENPEGACHISATLEEARKLCKHPHSQTILGFVENALQIT